MASATISTGEEAADGIRAAASRIVAAIRARRAPGGGQAPLFVLLGEVHDIAAHRLTQILALRELKTHGYSIAAGKELPCNSLEQSFLAEQRYTGFVPKGNELRGIRPGDSIHLKDYVARDDIAFARVSDTMLVRFLLREKIHTAFNDVAVRIQRSEPHLDLSHPLTRQVFANCGTGATRLEVGSPRGMQIRNIFLMAMAASHAAEEPSDLYIQFCGRYHIAGHAGERLAYRDSLSGVYERAGREVLAVPIDTLPGETLSRASTEAQDKDFILGGVHVSGPSFSSEQEWPEEREQAWLDKVMPQLLPDEDLHKGLYGFRDECADDRLKFFQSVLKRAVRQSPSFAAG